MEGVKKRLILLSLTFIFFGCLSSAQLCPSNISHTVNINRIDDFMIFSDELDQPATNCTVTLSLSFNIVDMGFLTSIEILELRNDQPDVDLRVVLSSTGLTLLVDDTHKRLILPESYQPSLNLTLTGRPGGSQVIGGYGFRARVSLTREADCGDDFVCSESSWIICIYPGAVCDGHINCESDYSDEINCDYCGQTEFDLKINQEVSIENPDVSSGVCVWQFQAPPSHSRILLRFINYDLNDNSIFAVSLSNITLDTVSTSNSPDYIIFQSFFINPSVPRERVVQTDYVWVLLANLIQREFQPPDKQSMFRLHVTALNETVECEPDEFLCDTGIQCVSNNTRCDGLPDCDDFSDELGCSDICQPTEFFCSRQSYEQCFSSIYICDGTKQCDDLRDEIGCAPSCGSHMIRLQPNQTHQLVSPNAPASYPRNIKCVWFIKAPQGTAVLISTVKINLDSMGTLTVGEGPRVDPVRIIWTRQGGTAPLDAFSEGNEVWVTLDDENAGYYLSPRNAHFILELSVLDQSVNCSGDYKVACESGYQCVNESDVCDGIFHCRDKSDELSCGQCESEQGLLCAIYDEQICLPKSSICNGLPDCPDFMDETLCSSSFCGSERYISLEDYPDHTYNISSLESGFPPLTTCLWVFTTSPEYRILLEVKRQNTSLEGVFTIVGNGLDPTDLSSQLGTFGGYSPLLVIASVGNSMWMTFIAIHFQGSGGQFWYQLSAYNDSVPCGEGMLKCQSSGLCIDSHYQCDGKPYCDDLSDEIGCDICNGQSTINITDDQVYTLRVNIEEDAVQFPNGKTCVWQMFASEAHRIQLTIVELDLGESTESVNYDLTTSEFVFIDGKRLKTTDLFYKNNDVFSKITATSKTNNVLIAYMPTFSARARFTVELQQFEPLECEAGDILCPSGLACIPEHELCDGTPQCPLLGDEIGCGSCSSGEYGCDGSCLNALEDICNGIPDCTDFSDEYNCLPCGKREIVLQNGTATSSPLLSPNYPDNYPNSIKCFWLVTADPGTAIFFEFSVFDLEVRYDTLKIGSGGNSSNEASVIARLTGDLEGVRVLTKTSQAWAQFSSDGSITQRGFSGTITQISPNDVCRSDEFSCGDAAGIVCLSMEKKCKGYAVCKDGSDEQNCGNCGSQDIHVSDDEITLTSPSYPRDYPTNTVCTWRIISCLSFRFVITVIDVVLEETYDYVTFSAENVVPLPGLSGVITLTGNTSPIRRLVRSDSTWVTFISDTSVTFKGFSFRIAHSLGNTTGCDEADFDCGNGICIDSAAECNGFNDCTNDQDEVYCDDVVCPGAYKCDRLSPSPTSTTRPSSTGVSVPSTLSSTSYSSNPSSSPSSSSSSTPGGYISSRCISIAKVCDGTPDCPGMDDETKCDVKKCPAGCECSYRDSDLNVTCVNGWNSTLLSGVAVTTNLLHLSGVSASSLESGTFKALTNLKVLSLKDSVNISEIKQGAFNSLDFLLWLDLSNTSLVELQESTFEGLPSLKGITIFDVPLEKVRDFAFLGLSGLETLILVRQHKHLLPLKFDKDAFEGLDSLKRLYVDDHRICCFFKSTVDCKTLEPEPPLFMCSNLMPHLVLKVFMWILGISALVGNFFVMIWRCREETEGRASRKVHSLLVFNLAASDSLMGLYMLIIAIADVHFGDTYFEQSSEWQTSITCRLAGFISIIASEASVFFLTLISIDRFLSIVFPFSSHHIRPKTGRIISALIWIGTVIVGLVPTILAFDSTSDLYGLSDVCIGLPLMTKVARYETRQQTIDAGGVATITVEIPYAAEYRASWFFSIALFLGVNLLCFCVILICYICIFVSVKMSMKRVRRHKKRDDEVRMAIKMAAIVMTDLICWTPVIIMGILSQSRVVEIPPETYAWVVVFILPINSSLNPYLYTISDICCQRKRSASTRKKDILKLSNNENRNSNSVDTVLTIIDAASKQE